MQEGLLKGVLCFLGVIAAVKFLPKVLGFTVRRVLFGFLSEVIIIVLAALLTDKVAKKLTGRDPSQDSVFGGS
jgi:hypothetical protein